MRLASRFGYAANQIRRDRPLTHEELIRHVPSIFGEDRHTSRSERYAYIPTITVLENLQREGFQPFFACQTRVRDQSRREYTKHMLRLRRAGEINGEMTPGERSLIQRALKTLDRHLHEPGVAFTSTHAAREWLILNMAGLEREEFRVLYLNNQNQLIAGETLFTGTINRTEVHPREVIKRALYHNAAAVVLAHNHPSGEVTPSKADRLITERLVQALALVDIRVPDHLIVGGSQVFSFAEHGLL